MASEMDALIGIKNCCSIYKSLHASRATIRHVHSDLAHHSLAMLLPKCLNSGLLLRYQVGQYIFQISGRRLACWAARTRQGVFLVPKSREAAVSKAMAGNSRIWWGGKKRRETWQKQELLLLYQRLCQ